MECCQIRLPFEVKHRVIRLADDHQPLPQPGFQLQQAIFPREQVRYRDSCRCAARRGWLTGLVAPVSFSFVQRPKRLAPRRRLDGAGRYRPFAWLRVIGERDGPVGQLPDRPAAHGSPAPAETRAG